MNTRISVTLLFGFLLLTGFCFAQNPAYVWAQSAGGAAFDYASSIVIDANGNIITSGAFSSADITFGDLKLNNTLTGYQDFFITKYDNAGNVLWTKAAGGKGLDYSSSVCTDAAGNVLIAGGFDSETLSIDNTTLVNTTKGNTGRDAFVAKYDANGHCLWAKSGSGAGYDAAFGVACDADNNVYVSGSFSSKTLTFGNSLLYNPASPALEIFLTKYDPAGNVVWTKSAYGTGADNAYSVTCDPEGNVLIAGTFEGGSIAFGNTTLTNAGSQSSDIFIAKYNTNGSVLWAKHLGGDNTDEIEGISVDAKGEVYVTGTFKSQTLSAGGTKLKRTGANDLFVAKYDASGNVLWAKSAGGSFGQYIHSISTDAEGNSIVSGFFNSTSAAFGNTVLTNTGKENIFMSRYDALGNLKWAKRAGGNNSDKCFAVNTDGKGRIAIAGTFSSAALTMGSTSLNCAGDGDYFITTLNDTTQTQAVPTGITEAFSNSGEINVYPNPFSESATIRIDCKYTDYRVFLYNQLGQEVYRMPVNGRLATINRKELPSGIYLYEISHDKELIGKGKLLIKD